MSAYQNKYHLFILQIVIFWNSAGNGYGDQFQSSYGQGMWRFGVFSLDMNTSLEERQFWIQTS